MNLVRIQLVFIITMDNSDATIVNMSKWKHGKWFPHHLGVIQCSVDENDWLRFCKILYENTLMIIS